MSAAELLSPRCFCITVNILENRHIVPMLTYDGALLNVICILQISIRAGHGFFRSTTPVIMDVCVRSDPTAPSTGK